MKLEPFDSVGAENFNCLMGVGQTFVVKVYP